MNIERSSRRIRRCNLIAPNYDDVMQIAVVYKGAATMKKKHFADIFDVFLNRFMEQAEAMWANWPSAA